MLSKTLIFSSRNWFSVESTFSYAILVTIWGTPDDDTDCVDNKHLKERILNHFHPRKKETRTFSKNRRAQIRVCCWQQQAWRGKKGFMFPPEKQSSILLWFCGMGALRFLMSGTEKNVPCSREMWRGFEWEGMNTFGARRKKKHFRLCINMQSLWTFIWDFSRELSRRYQN